MKPRLPSPRRGRDGLYVRPAVAPQGKTDFRDAGAAKSQKNPGEGRIVRASDVDCWLLQRTLVRKTLNDLHEWQRSGRCGGWQQGTHCLWTLHNEGLSSRPLTIQSTDLGRSFFRLSIDTSRQPTWTASSRRESCNCPPLHGSGSTPMRHVGIIRRGGPWCRRAEVADNLALLLWAGIDPTCCPEATYSAKK